MPTLSAILTKRKIKNEIEDEINDLDSDHKITVLKQIAGTHGYRLVKKPNKKQAKDDDTEHDNK